MTTQINALTALDAWKAGCQVILSKQTKDVFNMVTKIEHPLDFEESWMVDFNPKLIDKKASSLSDVVNTIFPYRLYDPIRKISIFIINIRRGIKKLKNSC